MIERERRRGGERERERTESAESKTTERRRGEKSWERGRISGYIKTGAGACQVLRCTQCISVRPRRSERKRAGEAASGSRNAAWRVHRRLLLKRKKGARP